MTHWITIPRDQDFTITGRCPTCQSAPPDGAFMDSLTFADVLERALDDPKWGKSAGLLRRSVKLAELFDGKAPGDCVPVDEKDFETLKDTFENPSSPYVPTIARQVMPLLDAVLEAPDKDPEGEAKAEARKLEEARKLLEAAEAKKAEEPPEPPLAAIAED